MFVAKYPNWVTQINSIDGKVIFFDGVKDMMVLYFNPEKYGVKADITPQKVGSMRAGMKMK